MPNSAEPQQPITATIMLIMILAAIAGLGWGIKKGLETNYPTKQQTINQQINK